VVFTVGLTGDETTAVKPASEYQVNVPVAQVAANVELCPEHMLAGLADAAVGAVGVGVTVTSTFAAGLWHTPVTQAAK
jgi:hypothetical protein